MSKARFMPIGSIVARVDQAAQDGSGAPEVAFELSEGETVSHCANSVAGSATYDRIECTAAQGRLVRNSSPPTPLPDALRLLALPESDSHRESRPQSCVRNRDIEIGVCSYHRYPCGRDNRVVDPTSRAAHMALHSSQPPSIISFRNASSATRQRSSAALKSAIASGNGGMSLPIGGRT